MGACGSKVVPADEDDTRKRLERLSGKDNPLIPCLSTAQLMEIHEAFAKFDRDGDGHIEAKELATVMRIMGMEPSEQQLQELIQSVDVDGNGKIELEEFTNLMARNILTKDGATELLNAFKLFDQDNSGFITSDEIRGLMTTAGEPLTQAECDEFLRLADPNGDGKISYEEFKNMECWKIPDTTVRRPPPKRQADAASSSGES